jgi:uncharacterized RDD family membrane protein YckC
VAVLDSASPRGLPVWATSAAIVIPFLFLLLISASEVAFAASPGKWLVGLTIRTPDARRAPRGRLLLRWAIKYSSLALIACSFAVRQIAHRLWAGGYVATADLFESAASWTAVSASAAFWITFAGCFLAFLPSRRALHDLLAGTAVFQVSQLRIAETGQHGFEVSPPAPQPLDAHPPPCPDNRPRRPPPAIIGPALTRPHLPADHLYWMTSPTDRPARP